MPAVTTLMAGGATGRVTSSACSGRECDAPLCQEQGLSALPQGSETTACRGPVGKSPWSRCLAIYSIFRDCTTALHSRVVSRRLICQILACCSCRHSRPRAPHRSVAPTATGWSDSCRAGFAPAEGGRLSHGAPGSNVSASGLGLAHDVGSPVSRNFDHVSARGRHVDYRASCGAGSAYSFYRPMMAPMDCPILSAAASISWSPR